MKKMVIDAYGGDYAPEEIVKGAILGVNNYDDIFITLTGKKEVIKDILESENCKSERISVVDAREIITPDEAPVDALRSKKDSSLVRALEVVTSGDAEVLISSGSTGAVLAGATLIVKRIKGVKRPALAPLLPTAKKGQVLLIDCGANVDCKASYLAQFALMGDAYCKKVLGKENPRIGLLCNGAEEGKGNDLTKNAFELIKNLPVNFAGNCEARETLSGDYDVIVADGFDGNILLKGIEGTSVTIMKMLKQELMSSFRTKIGAALAKPAFDNLQKMFSYEDAGGALLLGVNAGIIKTHGDAKAKTVFGAIGQARDFIAGNVIKTISDAILDSSKENER